DGRLRAGRRKRAEPAEMRQARRPGPAEVQPGQLRPGRLVVQPGSGRLPPHVSVPLLVEAPIHGYPTDLHRRLQQPECHGQGRAQPLLAPGLAEIAYGVAEPGLELGRVQRLRADHVENRRAQLVDLATRHTELREYRQVSFRRTTPDLECQREVL